MAYAFNDDKSKAEMADIVAEIIGRIYPVGSIYMSVSNVDPGTLFGGTWTAWGSGRVPVGVNSSDTDFNSVEKTGGEKTHTLTIAEIPSHTHTYYVSYDEYQYGPGSAGRVSPTNQKQENTGGAGSGQAHNNLQPYITCYMWKRTA